MYIQALADFTIETEGQKQPLLLVKDEYAELPNGAAQDAIEQGTARRATYAEATAVPVKEYDAPEAPSRGAKGKKSNPAKEE
jgi:hypothetical protein